MLNKRAFKPVPNNGNLMSVLLYESTSETNEEIFEATFLDVASTILNPGDVVKLLKKDIDNSLLCYVEYFIVAVDKDEKAVEFQIFNKHIFKPEAFEFLKDKSKSEEAVEKAATVKDNK